MNALVRALADLARRAPVAVIAVIVLVTGVLGYFSTEQVQDQSQESFSPDNDELRALEFAGEAFEGSSETLVQVLVRGGDVVSPEGLQTVQAVREAVLATVPPDQLGGEGTGPVVSYLAPLEGAIAQGQIDPSMLASDDAVDAAFQGALAQAPPEFSGLASQLVATAEGEDPVDADSALVLVFLDTEAITGGGSGDEAIGAIVDTVQSVADAVAEIDAPLESSAFAFELFFEPDESFQAEIGRLFGTAALIILVILFIVYLVKPKGATSRGQALRRAGADTGLTLFTILASITWMNGIGVLLGPDYADVIGYFSPPTQIIPILLIGLGVDYAIHLTSRYREEVSEGGGVDTSVGRAVRTVGIALVLATVTTAVGFLTNLTNPVPAIADFGILAAIGIVAAFLMMLTFVPAVRTLLDRRAERAGRLPREAFAATESRLSNVMASTSVLAEHAPALVLAVTVVLGGLGAYGLTQVSTEFSFSDFVPDGSEVKTTFEAIEDEFGGGFAERTNVVVQGDVATAEAHNATVAGLGDLAGADGVVTFGDQAAAESPVSAMGQVLLAAQAAAEGATGGGDAGAGGEGGDAPAGPAAPGGGAPAVDPAAAGAFAQFALQNGLDPQTLTFAPEADVAAVYDRLIEVDPDAAAVLARDGSGDYIGSQIVIQTRSADVGAVELAGDVESAFAGLTDAGLDVTATGNEIVTGVIVDSLRDSQISSLWVTLLAALVLLVVVFGVRERRPELGLVTLLPVALVVLWVFGTMAATGIPFGPVTAMISALAIGIGVPFTIHITHRFTEDLARFGEVERALKSTMRHTGGALAGSAFTTMAGFVILVTSSLVPFRQLGLVVAYAIGYSLLAAVIVLPSLLALWARFRHVPEHRDAEVPTAV